MVDAGVSSRRVRRWRPVSEKLQIVQLTRVPGASVAEVARAHGLNSNQLFKWRRAFERGELVERCAALIPVTMSSGDESATKCEEAARVSTAGSIHVELPGRAMISVESGADPLLVRVVIESLVK